MDPYVEMRSISYTRTRSGEEHLSYVRLDNATRRTIHERLSLPEPIDSGPWSWEEILLFGVSEMLMRREEQQIPLW